MKKNSLSFKIIKRVLLFCLGLGGMIFAIYYYYSRTTIEKATRQNAINLANTTISRIEQVIKPAEKLPENLAWMLQTGALPKDSIESFLIRLVKNNPEIFASAIAFEPNIFSEGLTAYAPYAYRSVDSIKTTDLWSPGYNYFIMDWYQIPAILNEPYWSEPYYDEGGGEELMTTYSVPFNLNRAGKTIFGGIITIDISLDWLTEIVNSVKIFENGYAFLVSRNGVYVTHPNRPQIMNETIFSRAKELEQPEMREIGRDMIHGISKMSNITLKDKGNVWIYHAQLPSTKWSLGVVYPHREMFASLHNLNLIILLLSLAGLGLLTVFTIRIINLQISPLTRFAKSARIIAEGNFDSKLPDVQTNDEMKELHDSFQFMQKELSDYIVNLRETTAVKEKIESELRIAREIQMSMIPHIFPPFPELEELDLFASLESAKEVGGDLYDFFLMDEKHLCFAIGDVSGKGVPASLFMAVTRTLLRSVTEKSKNAAGIVRSMNNTLAFNNESNMFVTIFVGILDISNGELSYCNAGHNPPVFIKKKNMVRLFNNTKAIPLGLFEDFNFTEEILQMEADDQIFLYTDGLTEAENAEETFFGEDNLLEVIRNNAASSPKELIASAKKATALHVNGFEQSDDLTMMSITYYGKNERNA
jgi:sigma-B regulation protein RsbU (phosphoserine phosphatase)